MLSLAISLLRNTRGTAVLETAIALPVMLMLCVGFVDLTIGFTEKLKLQQFAQSGADLVIVNFMDVPDDAAIRTEVSVLSGIPEADIAITRFQECDGVRTTPSDICASGEVGEYLQIVVTNTYEPALGNFGLNRALGNVDMDGSAVVRIN